MVGIHSCLVWNVVQGLSINKQLKCPWVVYCAFYVILRAYLFAFFCDNQTVFIVKEKTVNNYKIWGFLLGYFNIQNRFEASGRVVNLLKPTGYVMHQQFNIQQLYVLPTLHLGVLYLSENKQRLVTFTS